MNVNDLEKILSVCLSDCEYEAEFILVNGARIELEELIRLAEIGKIHDKRKKDLKTLGANIKAARKNAGLKQTEMAYDIDVAVRTISNWENGKNMPNESFHWKIERSLGVELDWGK